jgi:hypothetical protein
MKHYYNLLLLAFCASYGQLQAQGCSDAGFCSIGGLAQHAPSQAAIKMKKLRHLSLQLPAGVGDDGVFVFTPALQYQHSVANGISLQAKITANVANGVLASASGLGDIYLAGSKEWQHKNDWHSKLTLAVKAPLNTGNIKENGLSLPMQYQSSLGTVDAIIGFGIENSHWHFAAGWQQPLTGANGNAFLPEYWKNPNANNYPPTNDFVRKSDVLLRAEYMAPVSAAVSISAGLLGIYHLGNDTYFNANESPMPIAITGSQGLTLNATAKLWWRLNERTELGIAGGIPLVVRQVRPDGLTRQYVLQPEIRFRF